MTAFAPTALAPTATLIGDMAVVINNNVFFIFIDLEITKIVTRMELLNVETEMELLDIINRFEDI
jgi:hypothetical protein